MAETGRRAHLCDPTTTIKVVRQNPERALWRSDGLPANRTGERPVQTGCGLGKARKRHQHLRHSELLNYVRWLEMLASKTDLSALTDTPITQYEIPPSGPVVLTNTGIPLDEVEDLLLDSAAYRQASRILLPKQRDVRGRPLTPLHGGHVGLLCTAGMLNGVSGEGHDRHIAHWRSVKFTDHWEEEEEDGTRILHDRERFSHELTLVFATGKTQILTHEQKDIGSRDN